MQKPECHIFVGPTLFRAEGGPLVIPTELRALPPVQRGDVAALYRAERPGVMVLVDGLFHGILAVGHVEIREAIQGGWSVWGLSSMGAIRAYEMRLLGMRGYGEVYARFAQEEDFQDDEVALLHEPTPPYRPLTEPMVHLRAALENLHKDGYLLTNGRDHIEAHLKSLWYGERTLNLFADLLLAAAPALSPAFIKDFSASFDRFRIKTLDLQRFLLEQPWKDDQGRPAMMGHISDSDILGGPQNP